MSSVAGHAVLLVMPDGDYLNVHDGDFRRY
jgi:hypothetical protein